jgi:hypothetical protein
MILFRDSYVAMGAESMRENPIMPLGLVAILIEAAVLSWLFSTFFDGSLKQGLLLALAAGAFSMTYGALVVPAKFLIEPVAKYVLLELGFGVLHYAAAGAALAFVLRKS